MNTKQVNEYIKDNYQTLSDGEIAANLSAMGYEINSESVRKRRNSMKLAKTGGGGPTSLTKEAAERLGRLNELLTRSGIDPADIGEVKQIRVNEWQSMSKDADGEPVITDLRGASIVLSPQWAQDPELPLIRPAKPVRVSNPVSKNKQPVKNCAVIFPDQQIPFHDERAIDIALQILRDVNPSQIINLGDMIDFPSYSRFEQELRFQQTTQLSIDLAHQHLAQQRAAAPNAKIVVLEGNHDRRLQKSVTQYHMDLFKLRRANAPESWPVLSLPFLLCLDELGVEYIPGYPAGEYYVQDYIKCIHGRRTGQRGTVAKRVVDDERVTTVTGHTHRFEMVGKSTNTRQGKKDNYALTLGCLCRTDGTVPGYNSSTDHDGNPILRHEDWQQMIGVFYWDSSGLPFEFHPVFIWDMDKKGGKKQALFNGKRYTA